IRAPFAGRVLRREAEPGDLARTGSPMFVIADPAALRVTADIDERDVGRLSTGLEAVLQSDAFPGQTFASQVSELTPQGDSASRVFRARLTVPAGAPLRPGMTVEANLVVARRAGALLTPTEALSDGQVWVIHKGRAYARPVSTGARGVDRTEILSGLTSGETVILSPPSRLREGSRVQPAAGSGR
ncbi:MAG: efflux RND transporter periplasmic adaptor subunit, partial [Phenylobacterium sp.]|nr:efflux RND transporter periplasmic adaptor subunit [Phenylobacterium sp.]